ILSRVALPSAVLTLLLLGACLGGMWSIAHLQSNQEHILSKNVASLLAAQELELRLRQLRFHSFVYAIDPIPARRGPVEQDSRQFEAALAKAEQAAEQPAERQLVEAVRNGYHEYASALGRGLGEAGAAWNKDQVLHWSDAHSAKALAERCETL